MPRKKKENLTKPITYPVSARIKVLGKFYDSVGLTVSEAITNLKPPKGRGVSVLEVKMGDVTRAKILNPITTMRLFSPSHTQRTIYLKQVISIFQDLEIS